jgi:phosphatidate cytidylyltransferase
MKERLFFGGLMLTGVVVLMGVDGYLGRSGDGVAARGPMFAGLIGLVAVMSTRELGRLARGAGHSPLTGWACVVVGATVVMPFLEGSGVVEANSHVFLPLTPTTLTVIVGAMGTAILLVLRRKTENGLSDFGISLVMIGYLGLFASFVVRLRSDFPGASGAFWALYFITVTKFTDIGAYLVGSRIGRRKLIPAISPGKSVEGLLGGGVASLGLGLILAQAAGPITGSDATLVVTEVIVFSVLMSLIGQGGDLIVSLIKRDLGRKDSGALVPSFGGWLDIVDSPVLTAPLAWYLLTRWVG